MNKFTIWAIKSPTRFFLLATILIGVIIVVLDLVFFSKDNLVDILVEAHGLLYDLVVFGIIFTLYENMKRSHDEIERIRRNKENRIQDYQDEIEDFRGWDDPAAARRIRGSIIRLNRLDSYNIDLQDCYLRDVNLKNIILEGSNCVNTTFKNSMLTSTTFTRCELWSSNFRGSDCMQSSFTNCEINASFENANLDRCSFINCNLNESTFVGVKSMFGADFTNTDLSKVAVEPRLLLSASTLYGAKLDPELRKIIESAKPHLFKRLD